MLDAFSMGSAWLTVLFNFLQRSSYIKLHPQGRNNPQQSAHCFKSISSLKNVALSALGHHLSPASSPAGRFVRQQKTEPSRDLVFHEQTTTC